jgi:hypothetical protein
MRRAAVTVLALGLVLAAGTAGAAEHPVTTLPRPGFKAPVEGVEANAPVELTLVSSRYRDPALVELHSFATGVPETHRGLPLQHSFGPDDRVFAVYGQDGASARYLLSFDRSRFRYGFDFVNYVWPPRIAPGEREFVYEAVVWARESDEVLYVENAHWTYASSSYGRNAYITAIDLGTQKRLWRTRALVANARTFVIAGDYLVTGYGFTAERDFLYLIDRRSGKVASRLALPSAPERIVRRGGRIHVRTYDHDVVAEVRTA